MHFKQRQDNTQSVVADFIQKNPDLIRYNENSRNLGFDRNLVKVAGMARGLFVWFLGDDDQVVESGLNEVITFIRKIESNKVGLIVLGRESCFIEENSKKKIAYHNTVDEAMPSYFEISRREINWYLSRCKLHICIDIK